MTQSRQPAGVPVGGQFAPDARGRADVGLDSDVAAGAHGIGEVPETPADAATQEVVVTHTGPDGEVFDFHGAAHEGVQRQAELAAQGETSTITTPDGAPVLDEHGVPMGLPQYAQDYTPAQRQAVVDYLATLPLSELRHRQDVVREQTRLAYDQATKPGAPRWADQALMDLQEKNTQLADAVGKQTFGPSGTLGG